MVGKPDRVVFLDTTEVMSKGKSPVFAAALRRIAGTGHVVTSTLVLDELTKNYKNNRDKVGRNYARYFPADRLPSPPDLRQEFVRHLTSAGVEILPITVSLADIIEADLQGGKPFKEEGAGYRDFINWVTFVDCVKAKGAPAASFLTNNSNDFILDGKLPRTLVDVATARGCVAELEALRADDFLKQRLPVLSDNEVTKEQMDRSLDGWLSIAEDAEILRALRLPGPGPGIELRVVEIRDKSVDLLRGPEAGAVQMTFRATFDCIVVADYQIVQGPGWRRSEFPPHEPWATKREAVRLEWTVEAPYDKTRGVTGVPAQIAPMRRLDPATGMPVDLD